MKKIILGVPLFLLLWLYCYLFTYFWRYPAIYIHLNEPDEAFRFKMLDTDSGGRGVGGAGKDGVAVIFPKSPPQLNSELFIFWRLKNPTLQIENRYGQEELLLSSEEVNFCTMDVYLDANNSIVVTKQDNRQDFDCLKWVVKRNLLGID